MTLIRSFLPLAALLTFALGGCSERAEAPQAEAPPAMAEVAPSPEQAGGMAFAGKIDAGALYAETCAACHGVTGEGMADYPSLAALSGDDIQARLEAYRSGETLGPRSVVMAPIAKQLSGDQIAALASYLGG